MGDVRDGGGEFVVETKHAGFKPTTGQPKQTRDGMATENMKYSIFDKILPNCFCEEG